MLFFVLNFFKLNVSIFSDRFTLSRVSTVMLTCDTDITVLSIRLPMTFQYCIEMA